MATNADWFKSAVFYEVFVRSFSDENADGIGDLTGLTARLDYLQWLGIDCLWLPPFFPSPMRDGGYDVADYCNVHPEIGTLPDLQRLLDEAHTRGIRVIIDFVMNHTSDQHPWFQASRNDPDGPYGNFYVWRDAPDAYLDARVIFVDSQDSNWSYDAVRGEWFWHRFYAHQPDLNYEEPRVLDEILKALRFWLDLGVDGFRVDAVPYLIEADGTNCENLPGTHAILKTVRAMIDRHYPGRILLCEANQWPEDVVHYFGDSDECQMAFHFPVMPRLYMGLRRGSRASISAILADTPAIPATCQWATFLRNHDELTLEMVTEEDRDYMWGQYAPYPRMRCNIGIRRRLAPLVDNDPRRIKLLHALLLALPGSPVLYYGDEIGMGDNIWLPDRDGVRTPMQWDDSNGAGFSWADQNAFNYPLIADTVFGPKAVNVALQQRDPMSLLRWLRDMLALRRQLTPLFHGDFVDLEGPDTVFSFARHFEGETILAFNNLTDTPQVAEIDLSPWAGMRIRPVAGTVDGTPLGADPGRVVLPPYGFAWIEAVPR